MNVGIIGNGPLAFFYASWLGSLGHHVVMTKCDGSCDVASVPISSCQLEIYHSVTRCVNYPQIVTLPVLLHELSDSGVLLLVATVERVQQLVNSPSWCYLAEANIVLLTSWPSTYSHLRDQLPDNILPGYPVVAAEEWGGHLAAAGSSTLEFDLVDSLKPRRVQLLARLRSLGLNLLMYDMNSRFRARFAMTSFSYAYLRNLTGDLSIHSYPEFNLCLGLYQLRILSSGESDLIGTLGQLPVFLQALWTERETLGSIGWIVDILMTQKCTKVDRFISCLPVGS